MLQHYYDILAKDKFEALFGDLYIGKHPTRDRNSYLVLYLNFSGIVGELHNYRKDWTRIAKQCSLPLITILIDIKPCKYQTLLPS